LIESLHIAPDFFPRFFFVFCNTWCTSFFLARLKTDRDTLYRGLNWAAQLHNRWTSFRCMTLASASGYVGSRRQQLWSSLWTGRIVDWTPRNSTTLRERSGFCRSELVSLRVELDVNTSAYRVERARKAEPRCGPSGCWFSESGKDIGARARNFF
jgi:hypothetical protein